MPPSEVLVLPLGSGPELALIDASRDASRDGSATAAVWPGVGALMRSINLLCLPAGASTIRLEHPGESVYYVKAGAGSVVGDASDAGGPVVEGSMVHLSSHTGHRFVAGAEGIELFGGPCPPDPAMYTWIAPRPVASAYGAAGDDDVDPERRPRADDGTINVLHRDIPALMLPLISADARMIVWPGVGAWDATMNYVRMEVGEANVVHAHHDSEDTIVILEGRGSVADLTNDRVLEFSAGDVIHVPMRVRHAVRADRDSIVVSVGGPAPADLVMLRACGADLPERVDRP
jgi:quercetin dioxygenase-like cupin family protein